MEKKTVKLYGKLMFMTGKEKYSRDQYLNHECTHREFYGQFVTQIIKSRVENRIGIEAILKSEDKYFNDISLKTWDSIVGCFAAHTTLAEQTCILKEAANQLKDDYLSEMIPLPF